MTKLHTITKFFIGHILAGSVIIFGTLLVTLVFYIVGLAITPGGIDSPYAVIPEFLILMFASAVFGIVVAIASFLISLLFNWLRTKRQFPVWLPPIIVPPVTFVLTYLIQGEDDFGFVLETTGLSFVYFGTYWMLLTTSGALLDFLRQKFSARRTT